MSTSASQFISNENKGIIWEILIEQKLFNGIEQKHKYEIKDLFENTILMIENQGKGLSLIEKNKEVIKHMVLKLESFKSVPVISKREYTNEELQKERQKKIDNEFKKKQSEFDGLTKPIPEKIDFSDKLDEKIGDKMDELLAQAIATRELQLNQVIQTHNPETATKWIVGENTPNIITNNVDNKEQPKNLKIGIETSIQDNQIVNLDIPTQTNQHYKKMKVSFNESNNEIHNFSNDSPISMPVFNNNKSTTNIETNLFKILKKSTKHDESNQHYQESLQQSQLNSTIYKEILQDIIEIKREIKLLKNILAEEQ